MASMREDFLNGEEYVQRLNAAFQKHMLIIDDNAKSMAKLQAEYKKLPSDYLKMQREIQAALQQQAKTEKEVIKVTQESEKLKQAQIRTTRTQLQLSEAQRRATEAQEKAEKKAIAALDRANSLYGKVQSKVRELSVVYNDLAIKRELGLKLTTKEEAQLNSLTNRLSKYQSALSKVNSNVGKHFMNVGNYSSTFNGINNSIGQFARELPAIASGGGISTLLLAWSNQFGALQDSINGLIAKNKELIAQGQPVKSIFSQVVSSVFSLNTALYVGIALVTTYGAEISEWVSGLFGANEEITKLRENQEKLNQSQRTGLKNTVEARTALKENLAIARDASLPEDQRLIAMQKLRKEYPYFFKNLTDQQILAGETAEAEAKITEALNKRAQANEAANVIAENDRQIIDLRAQESALNKNVIAREKELKAIRERNATLNRPIRRDERQAELKAEEAFASAQSKRVNNQNAINRLDAQNASQQELILRLRKESIALDYTEEQTRKLQRAELKDVAASRFALLQTQLENEAEANKKILEDEQNGYADREHAAKRYGEILLELAQLRREEELRLIKKSTDDEISELKRRANEEEISWANANAVIKSIEEQAVYDRQLVWEKYAKDVEDSNSQVAESFKNVWSNLSEQERANRQMEFTIDNLRQMGMYLKNVDGNITLSQFAEIQNKMREIQESETDAQVENLRNQRQSIDAEIEKIKQQEKSEVNNEAINKLLGQQLVIDKQLLDIDNKREQAVADLHQQMKQATTDYLQGISNSSLNDMGLGSLTSLFQQTSYEIVNELGEIETKTGSVFDKLFDQAGTTQEKFAVAFNAISSIAQEAFAFITQASNASFQVQYDDLEKRQEIALKYTGESQAAQEEVNRQYEERRKEIKRRELKAQKEQAIFNAIINTAQGVTAALAQANIPLSIIIGALGAAQIAFIAGQQIPAYADGTDNHGGGLMLVNDAKGSNYREVIQTPDGSVYKPQGRNVLMNAPKGTKVHKSIADFESQLNGILMNNDIAPFADVLMRDRFGGVVINQGGGGITKEEMATLMAKYQNKDTFHLNLDKRGINTYWKGRDAINQETANSIKIKR